MAETIGFDNDVAGELPGGWIARVTRAGAAGVWTKADSVTAFDDFGYGPAK